MAYLWNKSWLFHGFLFIISSTRLQNVSGNLNTCSKNEFLCDGMCEPDFWKCDGEPDCADGADELGCDAIKCGLMESLCDDGTKCIYEWDFCNGEVNCDDGSDEKASRCPSVTTVAPTTEFACGNNEYKCNNASKCINKTKVCDTNSDCPDGDDEVSCLINECAKDNGNCSQICHDTETSYHCSCKHGYKMLNDSKTCEDINECDIIGKCSQKCINTEGSYKCSCTSDYVLSPNGRSCNPTPAKKEKLLLAVGLDIRSIENDGSGMKCLVSKNVKNVVAVGVHQKTNVMFWADEYLGKIFSSILGRNDTPGEVVVTDSKIKDLAIDWITEKMYWLTTLKGSQLVSTIYVAEFNGLNQKIVHTVSDDIRSIAVDPVGGYLYWTSIIARNISRSYMNGQHKEDIITTSLKAPTGLTIDYPNNKLFWLDFKMHHIESSDLDGTNRRRIMIYGLQHPFDIAVFGDNVYWSDFGLKTVSSANKFTGKNKTELIKRENITSFVPKGISILHSLSQPSVENRCVNNGGCSHLCLLVPNGFQCACPETGVLLPDQKNCKMLKPKTSTQDTMSTSTEHSTISKTEPTIKSKTSPLPQDTEPTLPAIIVLANATVGARSKSEGSGMNPYLLGGIIAGVLFILFMLIIVILCCRRKRNASKMEIYYSSEAANVKIVSASSKNLTQNELDVDDEEDIDNIGENEPVFKS